MSRFRILQVGDLHYPWAKKQTPKADFGSKPDVISNVTSELAPPGVALNKLVAHFSTICDPKPDLVAFVGDFGLKGEEQGIAEGIRYCYEGLLSQIFTPSEIAEKAIFVPGNHDVVRPANPSGNAFDKFGTYMKFTAQHGIHNNSVSSFSRVTSTTDFGDFIALGVNTCLGCGEFRSLPEALAKGFDQLIKSHDEACGGLFDEDLLGGLQEQLDIPFLKREDIDGLDMELNNVSGRRVNVVIGHHNLLPQKETRVLAYGELLNSGCLRETLGNRNHPVIYLHGHIHNETIELIRDPLFPDGAVLSICAPLITEGVNVVDVYYGEDLEIMGVDVIPWRFSSTLQLSKRRSLRISLAQGHSRLASLTPCARRIFNLLIEENGPVRLHLTEIADALDINLAEAAESCDALSWAGLVTISNSHKDTKKWDVRLAI